MKAVIFAAAKSPRLLPLTKELPVSLLKIKDKTILELQLEVLNKFDFSEIIITTGFQAEKIKSLQLPSNAKLFFNPFAEVSNIPATLYLLKEQLKEDFIFLYSDVLFKSSVLEKMLTCKQDAVLTIDATYKGEIDDEAEKIVVQNNLVSKLNKASIDKKDSDGEFIGLAKFSYQVFVNKENILQKAIKDNLKISFISYLNLLIGSGQEINFTNIAGDLWTEIDFPKDLKNAQDFKV